MKVAMLIPDNRDEFGEYDDPDPVFGPAPAALLEGMSQEPGLEVHIISCAKRPLRAPAKLAENMFFHLLHVRRWGWLRSAYSGCILAIRRKLQEIKPDLVHGQGTERYCALATVFSKHPNVITIHGNMRAIAKVNHATMFSYQWCAARLEEFTLPRIGGVICLSEYTRSLVSDKTARTWLIPNAVSNGYFKVRPAPQPESVDILCVGMIMPRKNQNMLIRALDSLAPKYNFRLIFLGVGNESEPYVREFLQLIQTRPWCVYNGFVSPERFQEFLSRAAALVLASLEDNCPMVVLEAAAAGVPVLAGNVGGVPSIIHDGHNGLLFDPNDLSSIAAATERYLSSPQFAQQMAANGRGLANDTFHPNVVSKRHIDVYREVLKADRMTPVISIVTPTFNSAATLRETIESVLAQDYKNWEHIVMDGGSTDGTVDILRSYPHLQWVSEKDKGHYHAMNKGIERATGDVIAILNGDDCYREGALSKVAEAFREKSRHGTDYSETLCMSTGKAKKSFGGMKQPMTTMFCASEMSVT